MTVINSEGKLFFYANLPILAFREVDECPPPVEPFPYTSPAHLDTHQCTETLARFLKIEQRLRNFGDLRNMDNGFNETVV